MLNKEQQIEKLNEQILNVRRLEWNASQMRDAAGVFRCRRELENLWRKLDALRK